MSQAEWARRVAEIGKLAGWNEGTGVACAVANIAARGPSWQEFQLLQEGETDPAVIAAIRQLCADWLAADGVVAVRVCRWVYDEHHEKWDGTCGVAWCMIDGGLAENHVNYCPRCGGKIEDAR